MIYEKEYQEYKQRLNALEQKERQGEASISEELRFHIKRINTYVNHADDVDSRTPVALLESDYVVSLREALRMMDDLG